MKTKVGRWWLVLPPLALGATVAAFTLASPSLSPASSPPSAPAGPACATGSLHARVASTDTGLGTTAMTIALSSDSATTCRLQGEPVLNLLGAHGEFVRAAVAATAGSAAAPVSISRAAGASFVLTYRNFDSTTGEACTPVAELGITPPGSAGQITVAAQLSPCGRVSVSEIRTGEGQGYS